MATDTRAELARLTLDFTEAFNEDDLDKVMGFFSDDAIYDEFHSARHEGAAAIRAAFAPQFSGSFGKVRFAEEDHFIDADPSAAGTGKALISWTCSIETKQGPGAWRGLDILHFRDGKVVQKHTYAKTKAPLMIK
ncbi:MAG: nuclear transport factor 2 family protein [Gammaproteobacteria bacterium]|nr:nuclear transport factor 2 family protein [Gammaproteobacteria bacterium]